MAATDKTAICLLIINKVPVLPRVAIESILRCTTNSIFIGFMNTSDVEHIPENPRINKIQLSGRELISPLTSRQEKYVDFSVPEFYNLVQYKWVLLQEVSKLDFKSILFTDFDVFWNKDPISEIEGVFDAFPEIDIQIQTYTSDPSNEQLCMGFVAFRNIPKLSFDLKSLRELHAQLLLQNRMTGDDDVITRLFHSDSNFRKRVFRLPQSTFPTGNLINVFSKRNSFPGLVPFEPFVFHANFVIGSKKKILLLNTFIYNSQFGQKRFKFIMTLVVKARLLIRRCGVFARGFVR